jgi:adenine phosphoribosyltransferase
MHVDAVRPGQRVLLVDDLLATGGTALAAAEMVREVRGEIAGAFFVVELTALLGRERLGGVEVTSLIEY